MARKGAGWLSTREQPGVAAVSCRSLSAMSEFDRGPSAAFAKLFDRVPEPSEPEDVWFDWGPVFYRGRLDGSARVLCVASDPGPTERIAGRSLVGNAGQRVQGLLAKLGLTRSYLCLNAWAYAVHPSKAQDEQQRLDEAAELEWRNELYEQATGSALEAVIASGGMRSARSSCGPRARTCPSWRCRTPPAATRRRCWTRG